MKHLTHIDREALQRVITYLWDSEKKHYNTEPLKSHIFIDLISLQASLDIVNRHNK